MIPNGYIIEVIKLINVSFIKIIWVLWYTAQKQDIKYQKNDIKIKLIMKNKINFIFKQEPIFFDFSIALDKSFSSLISKIFFSDKDNCFNIIFMTVEITEENKIWGIWYIKLKLPLSSYTLCIVSSLKKNPLIVKYKEKDTINKPIFIENKL